MANKLESLWAVNRVNQQVDWDIVFSTELPRIYNFFLYKTGERYTAEDLTAATFERAWKLRSRYLPFLSSLPTWLFGIARNVFKEYLRAEKKEIHHTVDNDQDETAPSPIDLEQDVQQSQEIDHLRKLLSSLPLRAQDLIALKYGAGLTNREIARITHLSESNVGSILHRSVETLRKIWENDNGR